MFILCSGENLLISCQYKFVHPQFHKGELQTLSFRDLAPDIER